MATLACDAVPGLQLSPTPLHGHAFQGFIGLIVEGLQVFQRCFRSRPIAASISFQQTAHDIAKHLGIGLWQFSAIAGSEGRCLGKRFPR